MTTLSKKGRISAPIQASKVRAFEVPLSKLGRCIDLATRRLKPVRVGRFQLETRREALAASLLTMGRNVTQCDT